MYLASAINIALVVLVIVTAGRAVSGKLQAQEDFGVFMLIFGIGGPVSLVCLITVIVGALVGLRTPNFSAQLLKSPVAVLGIINCTVPFTLLAAEGASSGLASVRNPGDASPRGARASESFQAIASSSRFHSPECVDLSDDACAAGG